MDKAAALRKIILFRFAWNISSNQVRWRKLPFSVAGTEAQPSSWLGLRIHVKLQTDLVSLRTFLSRSTLCHSLFLLFTSTRSLHIFLYLNPRQTVELFFGPTRNRLDVRTWLIVSALSARGLGDGRGCFPPEPATSFPRITLEIQAK